MKTVLPFLFSAIIAPGFAAEPVTERVDKLLPDAPAGFLHFAIGVPNQEVNEFYLKLDKVLAVRVGAEKMSGGNASVEIYTVAPGIEYSPQGEGKFLTSNQRFLLQFSSLEDARRAAASILLAVSKAEHAGLGQSVTFPKSK
ncbi:MAG TPA: hypothetical protein VIM46_00715 [Luteolibacter sp.]